MLVHWYTWIPLVLGLVALGFCMIGQRPSWRVAALPALAALVAGWALLLRASEVAWTGRFLFTAFSGVGILAGMAMVVQRNPVYSALSFAAVILATCGLFLLQSAPFLAAATVIVYAGAVIVTFLFVIMLAQQSGLTLYDQHLRQPLVASVIVVIFLGALITAIDKSFPTTEDPARLRTLPQMTLQLPDAMAQGKAILSTPVSNAEVGVHGLGRSLFGDYLWAVEIAGTVLLVTTIGAVLVARRGKGAAA